MTWAEGFTVIVNVCDGPLQMTVPPVKVGVTVIVATTGEVVVLMAVKDAIFPVPPDAKPMLGVLLLHEYVVGPPVLVVVKVTAAVGKPWHTTWSGGSFT